MLSKDLEQTLSLAFQQARDRRHEFMTVEHLLLALLDNVIAVAVLTACEYCWLILLPLVQYISFLPRE